MDDNRQDINFSKILKVCWNKKFTILIVFAITTIFSSIIALKIPNKFQSFATVTSNENNNISGELGSSSLSFLGLGPTSKNNNIKIALETIETRYFLINFIKNRGLVEEILEIEMSADKYKKLNNLEDKDIYDLSFSKFKSSYLSVSYDPTKDIAEFAIKHQDPHQAKNWLEWILNDLDNYIRSNKKRDSDQMISFLKSELNKLQNDQLKSYFADSLAAELRAYILINSSENYVFQYIEYPFLPVERYSPSRTKIVIFSNIFVIFFLVVILLLLDINKRGSKSH